MRARASVVARAVCGRAELASHYPTIFHIVSEAKGCRGSRCPAAGQSARVLDFPFHVFLLASPPSVTACSFSQVKRKRLAALDKKGSGGSPQAAAAPSPSESTPPPPIAAAQPPQPPRDAPSVESGDIVAEEGASAPTVASKVALLSAVAASSAAVAPPKSQPGISIRSDLLVLSLCCCTLNCCVGWLHSLDCRIATTRVSARLLCCVTSVCFFLAATPTVAAPSPDDIAVKRKVITLSHTAKAASPSHTAKASGQSLSQSSPPLVPSPAPPVGAEALKPATPVKPVISVSTGALLRRWFALSLDSAVGKGTFCSAALADAISPATDLSVDNLDVVRVRGHDFVCVCA